MKHDSKLFKWKHFSGIIIMWSVRWYGRYALSYNDLREIAAERELKINRSTRHCCKNNTYRPHQSFGNLTPMEYFKRHYQKVRGAA